MKRYTLRYKTADSVAPELLKAAVEDVLLHLHPGITFRMGRISRIDPQNVSVEIASEGKKEALFPPLSRINSKIPVALERIDWGWDSGESSLASSMINNPDLSPDPLAKITAPAGPAVFSSDGRIFWLRYIGFFLLTLGLGISIYEKFSNDTSLLWDGLFLGFYTLWLFSLSGIRLDPRGLARKIDCREDGLEVTYRFRRTPARLRWADIQGMDFTYTACIILGNPSAIKIALNEYSGFKQKNVIQKIIVERASLRFVEGRFWRPYYRRAEAA
jgi:hypothetical protein